MENICPSGESSKLVGLVLHLRSSYLHQLWCVLLSLCCCVECIQRADRQDRQERKREAREGSEAIREAITTQERR
jgi:hypothetical protein